MLRTNFSRDTSFNCYLASKIVIGEEEVYKRWIKSDLNYNYLDQGFHNLLLKKLDDEQLEGSDFFVKRFCQCFNRNLSSK